MENRRQQGQFYTSSLQPSDSPAVLAAASEDAIITAVEAAGYFSVVLPPRQRSYELRPAFSLS